MIRTLMLAALLLPLAPVAASAQTPLDNPAGPWVHAGAGVSFPETQGDFKRATITQFDGKGLDIGVIYHLVRNGEPLGLTGIYIYPARGSCEVEWKRVTDETLGGGGKVLSEDRAPSPSGKTPGAAYHAKLDLPLGGPNNPVASTGYLYCSPDGKWLVKYFATWRGTADLEGATIGLIRSISWPAALAN